MEKSKALEFLKQALTDIPNLRNLHYKNPKFNLWCARVETIIKEGLNTDDYNTLLSVKDKYLLDDIVPLNLEAELDYPQKIEDYVTAVLSIIQKYEMLGVKGEAEKDKGGKVEMDKKKILAFLNEKMQEVYELETLPPNNAKFPRWCSTIEGFLYKVFGKDSWEYETFKEAGILRGFVDDEHTQYRKSVKSRDIALASIIDTIESTKYKEPASTTEPPKAFIAHGGKSEALDKLKEFLVALGVEPLIVEEQASENRSVGNNVDSYARQADCAIILATKGDIDGVTGGFVPRGNVLVEIGKAQELFKDRIIYLLQAGTKFPTNVSEKVWGRFTSSCMDETFIKVARELQAFGLLKAVKPQE